MGTPEQIAIFLHNNLCQNEEHEEHGCGFDGSNIGSEFLALANNLLAEFSEDQIRRFVDIITTPFVELAKNQDGP